jgi:hypothetical protein
VAGCNKEDCTECISLAFDAATTDLLSELEFLRKQVAELKEKNKALTVKH